MQRHRDELLTSILGIRREKNCSFTAVCSTIQLTQFILYCSLKSHTFFKIYKVGISVYSTTKINRISKTNFNHFFSVTTSLTISTLNETSHVMIYFLKSLQLRNVIVKSTLIVNICYLPYKINPP